MKKLILALNFRTRTSKEKIEKVGTISAAHAANAGYVPNLNPATTVVDDKLDVIKGLYASRDLKIAEVQGISEDILAKEAEVTNIVQDKWLGQTQNAIAGDMQKAKTLGYDIKGEQAQRDKESATYIATSKPLIAEITFGSLTHNIEIINSESKDYILPIDASTLELYEYIGETCPTSIKKMTYLGPVKKGKYTSIFEEDDLGKTVWYIAVYRGKDPKKLSQLSVKMSATII